LACGCAPADSARRWQQEVFFIVAAVAIVISRVARCIVRCRLSRLAGILDLATLTACATTRGARTNAAGCVEREIVLIGLTVAVIVDRITQAIVLGRSAGLAGIDHSAARASQDSAARTGADATRSRVRRNLFVLGAIAVIVHAVTSVVHHRDRQAPGVDERRVRPCVQEDACIGAGI
jgi:hypothetical protein